MKNLPCSASSKPTVGQGVEVVTGSHTTAEYLEYAAVAKEFGMAASRGSDFHSPDESRIDLGTLPMLPGDLTPVWELVKDKIQPALQNSSQEKAL